MIVALNNKSNLDKNEFLDYLGKLNNIKTNSKLILCPTFINIANFNSLTISLGSQNVSSKNDGAYTGEVSAKDLNSYNVKYCIVGHSERREYQKESDEEIKEKINRLIENNIIPILCIGETKQERINNSYKEILKKELDILNDINNSNIIIAYEPIWSIGTGIIPTKEEIIEVFDFIKSIIPNCKVLYGGSANTNNIDMLKSINQIDGYLLGGLSLKPDDLQVFLDKLN
ncbi:MAG: triose-phosphate isomerase [Bacilli bacterium]|nr:triose-phosphate isomerase [Bacilli bacterium]